MAEAEHCSPCDPGGELVLEEGGDGGRDGGGVGRTRTLPGSGTTRVFSRGPAGESPAAGDARACFFASAPVRSGCFGVCGCMSDACGIGGGGSGGGVGGRSRPGGSVGGDGCAGAPGVAALLQKPSTDLTRNARAFSMSAA